MVTPSVLMGRRTIGVLGYQVHVGPWLLDDVGRISVEAAPARTYAIITDENVSVIAMPNVISSLRQYAPDSRMLVTAIVPGEQRKTRDEWARLTDWLLEKASEETNSGARPLRRAIQRYIEDELSDFMIRQKEALPAEVHFTVEDDTVKLVVPKEDFIGSA